MSTGKFIASTLWGGAKLMTKAVVKTAKTTGNALHSTANFVAEHKQEIGTGAKYLVKGTGAVVRTTGKVVQGGTRMASTGLHGWASGSDSTLAKVTGHTLGYAADAINKVGAVTTAAGHMVEKAAPVAGTATGSLVSGTLSTTSNMVDSITVTQGDIRALAQKHRRQSLLLREQSDRRLAAIDAAIKARRKKDLLDLLVVGGVTLATILKNPASVPPEVEEAFSRAYPGLAGSGETFAEAVQRTEPERLVGLVNGVKGKLFEIELVEHLNNGNLPDGLYAELASSSTQRGFDVRILDENGQVVDLLQAKATESAAYVKQALERYPDIDVMTTTEVHSRLVAMGAADQVTNSGISEAALQAKVESAASSVSGSGFSSSDLLPSGLGMAIIALSVLTTKDATAEMMADEFGQRTAKAGVGTAIGNAAMVVTGTWWLGLAAGLGGTWLSTYGGNKRERYEALKRATQEVTRASSASKAIMTTAKLKYLS